MNVISDAGPLVALAKVNHLSLLESMFDKVYITSFVYKELMATVGKEAQEIEKALNEFIFVSEESTSSKEIENILRELGAGEKQSIEFAYTNKSNCILLMDDKAGRRDAQLLNIPLTGTIGILIIAKSKGLVENVARVLQDMREKGYWLSDEIIKIAKKAAYE